MLYFHEIPSEEEPVFPSVVVSYGGPQSNAMLALAATVHWKKKRFVYYTKKLPRWLRKTPSGNFLRALSLGMELREVEYGEYSDLFGGVDGGSSVPPSGLEPPIFGDSLWVRLYII